MKKMDAECKPLNEAELQERPSNECDDDCYIRLASSISPRLGCSPLEEAKLQGGPSCGRSYEIIKDRDQAEFPRNKDFILAKGAAAGRDPEGRATHFRPGLQFLGFINGEAEDRVNVLTRGSVILRIPGADESDHGRKVYAQGPNKFTLTQTPGSVEIGRIRYLQGDRCAVAFRRFDDPRPLNLKTTPG